MAKSKKTKKKLAFFAKKNSQRSLENVPINDERQDETVDHETSESEGEKEETAALAIAEEEEEEAEKSEESDESEEFFEQNTPTSRKRISQKTLRQNDEAMLTPKSRFHKNKTEAKQGTPSFINKLSDRSSAKRRSWPIRNRDQAVDDGTENIDENLEDLFKILEKYFKKEIKLLKKHISSKIKRPFDISDEQHMVRQYGRMKFHVFNKHSDDQESQDFYPIDALFPRIYYEFMNDQDKLEHIQNNMKIHESQIQENRHHFELDDSEIYDQYVEYENVDDVQFKEQELSNEIRLEVTECMDDIIESPMKSTEEYQNDYIRSVTKIRKCDEHCEKIPEQTLKDVDKHIRLFLEKDFESIEEQRDHFHNIFKVEKYDCDVTHLTMFEIFFKYSICYQGFRTLIKRCNRLHSLLKKMTQTALAQKSNDIEKKHEVLQTDDLPYDVKFEFLNITVCARDDTKLSEDYVRRKYRNHILEFNNEIKQMDSVYCKICRQFRLKSLLIKKSGKIIKDFVDFIADEKKTYQICRICSKSLSKKTAHEKLPSMAIKNGLEVDETPEVLKKLNIIERCLIQKSRFVANIFRLNDASNRNISVPATQGCSAIIPVVLENVDEEKFIKLPDASNMIINIDDLHEKTHIVSMKRIVDALKWLQKNNPEYFDITIDSKFGFELNKHVFSNNQDLTEQDVQNLVNYNLNSDSNTMLPDNFHIETLQSNVTQSIDKNLMWNQYVQKNKKRPSILLDIENIDIKIFPYLYPYGKNGFNHQRKVYLKNTAICRAKLLSENRMFANNSEWITFSYTLALQKCLTTRMGIQARCSSKITGSEAISAANEDIDFQSSMTGVLSKIKGTDDFWNQRKFMLRAHCYSFGPPTIFLTLNPNLTTWFDLFELYSDIYKCVVDSNNIREFISLDPVIFSRYFKKRVDSFFKSVILKNDGPFGKVIHYYKRIEYQARGTQHCHCLLWLENRPSKESTDEYKTEFVNSIMCAREPDEKKEKKLYEIIKQHQKHSAHTKYCSRIVKHNSRSIFRCHFNFPQPQLAFTMFKKHQVSHFVPGMSRKSYMLARKKNENDINDYNPILSLIWNGNIDVQYLDKLSINVIEYVTSDFFKFEQPFSGDVLTTKEEVNQKMMEVFRKYLNSRPVGTLEMVDVLLSHPVYKFDCSHIFINTDKTRTRILKPLKNLRSDELATMSNMVDDYYPNRPKTLKNFSYINICMNFDVVDKSRVGNLMRRKHVSRYFDDTNKNMENDEQTDGEDEIDDIVEHFSDDESSDNEEKEEEGVEEVTNDYEVVDSNPFSTHYSIQCEKSIFYCHPYIKKGQCLTFGNEDKVFIKRRAKVPRFFIPHLNDFDHEKADDFYRRWVMLVVPWNSEKDILKLSSFNSYQELFENWLNGLKNDSEKGYIDIKQYMENIYGLQEEEQDVKLRNAEIRKTSKEANLFYEDDEEFEVTSRDVDIDEHIERVGKMNDEQRKLFDLIMEKIEKQAMDSNEPQIKMMVSGYGGVGKSFLIHSLANELTLRTKKDERKHKPAVLLAAPTGRAAAQISGSTIHSLLSIGIDKENRKKLLPLSAEKRELRHFQFSNLKLLIVDEISMVGNETLLKMDSRLREITGNNSNFGGINICFFGDLLQLPPVKQPKVFENVTRSQLQKIFGYATMETNLWHGIQYFELHQNMRQEDDKFSNILANVRTQQMTDTDIHDLENRLVEDKEDLEEFFRIQKEDPRVMALFPLNAECGLFNSKIIKLLKNNAKLVKIESRDIKCDQTLEKSNRIWQRREFSKISSNEPTINRIPLLVNGLPKTLELFQFCRVMLRRNIDIEKGLVNGMCGVVEEFNLTDNGSLASLGIRFDHNPTRLFAVERSSVRYKVASNEYRERSQFPVVPAYGVTIHKAQGLTLNNVFISTKNIFAKCQLYVAVSRVKTMTGLHFFDFDKEKIMVDIPSLEEVNRLRSTINLPQIKTPKNGKMPNSGPSEISLQLTPSPYHRKPSKKSFKRKSVNTPETGSKRRPRNRLDSESSDFDFDLTLSDRRNK